MESEYGRKELPDFEDLWDNMWAPKIVQNAINENLVAITSVKDMEAGTLKLIVIVKFSKEYFR